MTMVDPSVGSKAGVNHTLGKNMIALPHVARLLLSPSLFPLLLPPGSPTQGLVNFRNL